MVSVIRKLLPSTVSRPIFFSVTGTITPAPVERKVFEYKSNVSRMKLVNLASQLTVFLTLNEGLHEVVTMHLLLVDKTGHQSLSVYQGIDMLEQIF